VLIEGLDARLRCTRCGARGQARLIAVEAAACWASHTRPGSADERLWPVPRPLQPAPGHAAGLGPL